MVPAKISTFTVIHILIQYLLLLQTMIPNSQLIFLPSAKRGLRKNSDTTGKKGRINRGWQQFTTTITINYLIKLYHVRVLILMFAGD